ncbi:MAG: hypothetical protein ACKVPX_06275 [Myxococcaceae bacterium]
MSLLRWFLPAAGLIAGGAFAQDADADDSYVEPVEVSSDDASAPAAPEESPFLFTGYIDIGYAYAQGNGTSWPEGDTRIPADYVADPFATAVNSRGDVASVNSRGLFVNGFLPRSMGIGGRPSFLINTVNLDIRYTPRGFPLMFFIRTQLMPRFGSGPDMVPAGLPAGNQTRVWLQQVFARLIPFNSVEFALLVGKFDSVFGIEYLDNEANLRTGITPTTLARYTTGQSLGIKAFYRVQIPAAWSAFSINASITNSGTRIESLQPPDLSFSGIPVAAARLGYELNLPKLTFKLGGSGLIGPRNDQRSARVQQWMLGLDARLYVAGVSVAGEILRSYEAPGIASEKFTGLGEFFAPSGFKVDGFWVQGGYTFTFDHPIFQSVALYGRFERRNGTFHSFTPVKTARLTVGGRVDVYRSIAIKFEALLNRELPGTASVDNDVFTSSAVYTF